MRFESLAKLVNEAEDKGCSTISELMMLQLTPISSEQLYDLEKSKLDVMKNAVKDGSKSDIRDSCMIAGGDGFRMQKHTEVGRTISGEFCTQAIAKAIAISECNAAMGKIVACPTAGSCGIVPAAILTMMEIHNIPEDRAVMSLLTAHALAAVIATNGSISGAEAGCAAECGSAAAMAAGAMVELFGGIPAMVADACAIAVKNQLGLVCDPVAGLVEVPCIKRNAGGVMCAIGAAEMALAGIKSIIPVDEVILTMLKVGKSLPKSLRETSEAGLSTTDTALEIGKKVAEKNGGCNLNS